MFSAGNLLSYWTYWLVVDLKQKGGRERSEFSGNWERFESEEGLTFPWLGSKRPCGMCCDWRDPDTELATHGLVSSSSCWSSLSSFFSILFLILIILIIIIIIIITSSHRHRPNSKQSYHPSANIIYRKKYIHASRIVYCPSDCVAAAAKVFALGVEAIHLTGGCFADGLGILMFAIHAV